MQVELTEGKAINLIKYILFYRFNIKIKLLENKKFRFLFYPWVWVKWKCWQSGWTWRINKNGCMGGADSNLSPNYMHYNMR